ncbi:hypothetical protein [Photobacterium phosphoreum]|uniref:hypothetical protein n=1 Tax=Photobacterium phosphoreum TaxID=659 RepID=UPI0005D39CF5|nr:hypothetical protein [Photobacterium phosphoreum]KJF86995.1 hypothetical protein UB41_08905 [Photobacterium phosphoreum]
MKKNLEDAISSQETFLKIDNIIQEKKLEETELIKLEKEIELKEENSKERRFSVLNSISKYSKRLLELDIGSEESFKHATSLSDEINFSKDEWSLGGRVAFSDSSNVVKKK